MNDWSIKSIQDIVLEKETWEKKNLYATDSSKCPSGIYHQLCGAKETTPVDPRGERRMEVGSMVEANQIKKLRSQGLLIEAQRRIVDTEFNVSGRHDGLVISPTECTDEAKKMIERKKEIFKAITSFDKIIGMSLESYRKGEIDLEKFLDVQTRMNRDKQSLYDEEWTINQELLKPDPKNSIILMEIKSIVEKGFEWRQKDGKPMDDHRNQLMFYLWKLREIYPWLLGRVVYVDTSYQNLLEFNIEFDEKVIEDLKKFWSYINQCVKDKVPPPAVPAVVQNPYGKWQVNYQAEWCRYHIHCTGDANWKTKAIEEVERLNQGKTTTRRRK